MAVQGNRVHEFFIYDNLVWRVGILKQECMDWKICIFWDAFTVKIKVPKMLRNIEQNAPLFLTDASIQ